MILKQVVEVRKSALANKDTNRDTIQKHESQNSTNTSPIDQSSIRAGRTMLWFIFNFPNPHRYKITNKIIGLIKIPSIPV